MERAKPDLFQTEGAIHIRFEPLENDCRRITISTPAGDDRLAALPT